MTDRLDTEPTREPLDAVVESFVQRFRRGEQPSISEYVARYPELADRIHTLFPALVMLEGIAGRESEPSLSPAGRSLEGCERLGDFRIIREIGRGGMGVVYEAEQESLGRRVALKVLNAHPLVQAAQVERFLREARAAAQLHHTHIVPVYGVGQEQDRYYYVMQLIHGRPLDDVLIELRRLRDEESPSWAASTSSLLAGIDVAPESTSARYYWRAVAQIGVHVADALEYANSQGMLHRDVKPSNLLLDHSGAIWVTDFGLVKLLNDADLTRTGDVVGTLRYMAPERFEGRSDPRSDIYGLGATLYELLTLQPAFNERNPQRLVRQLLRGEPPRPSKLNPDVPPDLETIVLKAMVADPAGRYVTAGELAEDLQRFLADRPIRARRVTSRERLWRWARRNPAVASLSGLVGLLLLAVVTTLAVSHARLRDKHQEAGVHLRRAVDAELAARQSALSEHEAHQLASRRLYDATVSQARAGRRSGDVGQRFTSLETLAQAACLADELGMGDESLLTLRNEAICCLQLDDLRPRVVWPDPLPKSSHLRVAFDRDLQRYAVGENSQQVAVRSVADNQLLARVTLPPESPDASPSDHRPCLRFSSDGRLLAAKGVGADGQICLRVWQVSREALDPRLLLDTTAGGLWHDEALDFSPDMQWLAAADKDGITLHPLTEETAAAPEPRYIPLGGPPHAICWRADGLRLAVGRDRLVQVVDPDGNRDGAALTHADTVTSLAWSTNMCQLAVGCADRRIYLWNTDTRRLERACDGHRESVRQVAFNARGDLLASWGWDAVMRLWDPGTGREVLSSTGIPAAFAADDLTLAIVQPSEHIGVWDVSTKRHLDTFLTPNSVAPIHRVQVVFADRFLAASGNNRVDLWDLETGRHVAEMPGIQSLWPNPRDQSLLSVGKTGVLRWTWVADESTDTLGPPEVVSTTPFDSGFVDRDGQRLAAAFGQKGVKLWNLRDLAAPPLVLHQASLADISLSPDGRWLVTAPRSGEAVKVWNAASGELHRTLAAPVVGKVLFSPDNRWLVVRSTKQVDFWRVADWTREFVLPCRATTTVPVAFSDDATMLAISSEPSQIRLIEVHSRRELATFGSPTQEQIFSLCFSPTGRHLIAGTTRGPIHVWDLHGLRHELAGLGLDWDSADLPPVPEDPARRLVAVLWGEAGVAPPQVASVTTKYATADIGHLTAAILQDPSAPEAYEARGHAYARVGRKSDARLDFLQAVELFTSRITANPDDAASYVCRGHCWMRLGNDSEAIADFGRAIRCQPNNASLHASRADAKRRMGRYMEAQDDYTRAIELDLQFQHAIYYRGLCRLQLQQRAEAVADFRRSLELRPVDAWPCQWLAWIYLVGPDELRDAHKALPLAREAARLYPQNPFMACAVGGAYYRLGDWQRAVEHLEHAISPGDALCSTFGLLFRTMAHHQRGATEEALADYQQAVDWLESSRNLSVRESEELGRLRAEAEWLLADMPIGQTD